MLLHLNSRVAAILIVLGCVGTASAQSTWTALDVTWYRKTPAQVNLNTNSFNVPMTVGDEKVWVRFTRQAPHTPCNYSNGAPICIGSYGYPTISEKPTSTFSSWDASLPIPPCLGCDEIAPTPNNLWTTLPSTEFKVGFHYLRFNLTTYINGFLDTSHSPSQEFFLTRPDVADIHAGWLDILDEKHICGGAPATATFRLINGGELAVPDAIMDLYSAATSDMSGDPQWVASFSLGQIHGGWPISEFTRTFTFPNYAGKRYFALKARETAGVPFYHTPWGERDAISLKADVSFTNNPWIWLAPQPISPATVPTVSSGGVLKFQFQYQNNGTSTTSDNTAVLVEMKAKNGSWQALPGVLIPIGAIPCQSGVKTSPIQIIVLGGSLTGPENYGKKRAFRLRFVNAGTEQSLNNNKSKSKDVYIGAPPVAIDGASRLVAGHSTDLTKVGGAENGSYEWTLAEGASSGALVDAQGHVVNSISGTTTHLVTWQSFDSQSITVSLLYTAPGGDQFTAGHVVAVSELPDIEVSYRAFLQCEYMPLVLPVIFTTGDARTYGYQNSASRGMMTFKLSWSGITPQTYVTSHALSSIVDNCLPENSEGTWCQKFCHVVWEYLSMVICGPEEGPVHTFVPPTYDELPASSGEHQAAVLPFGFAVGPGCSGLFGLSFAPDVDANGGMLLRQVHDPLTGQLGPIEFTLLMNHDKFPWHEVYLNGSELLPHVCNPCDTETTMWSLVDDPVPYLYQWSAVPGLP